MFKRGDSQTGIGFGIGQSGFGASGFGGSGGSKSSACTAKTSNATNTSKTSAQAAEEEEEEEAPPPKKKKPRRDDTSPDQAENANLKAGVFAAWGGAQVESSQPGSSSQWSSSQPGEAHKWSSSQPGGFPERVERAEVPTESGSTNAWQDVVKTSKNTASQHWSNSTGPAPAAGRNTSKGNTRKGNASKGNTLKNPNTRNENPKDTLHDHSRETAQVPAFSMIVTPPPKGPQGLSWPPKTTFTTTSASTLADTTTSATTTNTNNRRLFFRSRISEEAADAGVTDVGNIRGVQDIVAHDSGAEEHHSGVQKRRTSALRVLDLDF